MLPPRGRVDLEAMAMKGVRTGDPCGFNKGRSSKFCVGSRVRQTPKEGQRTYRQKRCRNNNKDEDNRPKTLNDKAHQRCFFYVDTEASVACCPFQTMYQGFGLGRGICQKNHISSVVHVSNRLCGVASHSRLCNIKPFFSLIL